MDEENLKTDFIGLTEGFPVFETITRFKFSHKNHFGFSIRFVRAKIGF